MKIKFKKFDKGIFFLDYMDEDLLSESLEIKLISYTPNGKVPFNFKVDIPSLSGVDRSVLSNFIDMKIPHDMSKDEVTYMLSDVTIERASNPNCTYDLDYTHKISPTEVGLFITNNLGLESISEDAKGSLSIIMDGLEFEFNLDSYRVRLRSSFKVIGSSNSLMNFYLEIIGMYIQHSLDEFGIKFLKYN